MKLVDALEVVARTDPGRVRAHNEDALYADASLGVAILADGMGGYNAGEVASGLATTRLAADIASIINSPAFQKQGFSDPAIVERHIVNEIAAANQAIFNAARSCPDFAGMGTTLVMAVFYDNRMSVAHVGDSRLYRLRGQCFEQLTRDHSFLQDQLDSGMISAAQARYSEYRNLVTRALGVEPEVKVDINDFEVQAGDIVLLCSDGLNEMVDDDEIAATLSALGGNLGQAADHLVQQSNAYGGRDNISVILIKVVGDFASSKGCQQRTLAHLQ